MEWKFSFINDGIIKVKTKGDFSLDDFQKMIVQMLSYSRWVPGMNRLYDNRELNIKATDINTMYNIGMIQKNFEKKFGRGRLALLVKDFADYDSGRLYQNVVNGRIESEVKIFISYDEAMDWVKQTE